MELLKKYIGDWGRYQALLYLMFALPFALSGIQVMAFSFTGAVPKARCVLPGIDNVTAGMDTIEFNSSLLQSYGFKRFYAKPAMFGGKENYCSYCQDAVLFPPAGDPNQDSESGPQCSEEAAIPCSAGVVYDRSQFLTTLVAKFDMVCANNWKRSLASSLYMLGFFVGAALSGVLSDRFGRRPVFLVLSFAGALGYHLIILVPNFPLLCIFHVFNGACTHGAYITAFVIVMEYIGGFAGTVCGVWVQGIFAIGYIYVGICAYFIRDWQWLQFALAAPSLFLLPLYWVVPESVRWLIVHGRHEEAAKIIHRGIEVNQAKYVSEQDILDDIQKTEIKSESASVLDLLRRDCAQARVTLIVFFLWFATSMTYYGLALNSGDLPGSDYLNYLILGLVELPGYLIAMILMEKMGRRLSNALFFGIGGAAIIISTFLPKSASIGIVVLASVGKMFASATFAVVYNYSAELFPTVARNAGIGFASSCARIASISAPQIYLIGQFTALWVPFLVYGLVGIMAAVFDMGLPETKGCALPETLQDGVALARKKWRLTGNVVQPEVTGVNNFERGDNNVNSSKPNESKF